MKLRFLFIFFVLAFGFAFGADAPIITLEEPVAPVTEPKDQDLFFKEFLNMLTTLGLIVAALLFISWFMKKMLNNRVQQINTSSLIKIIERRALSPKAQVYIVEIHGKTLVLGESPTGLTKITEYEGIQSVEE